MKGYPLRASSILAVLGLLVAINLPGTAQRPTTQQEQRPTDQQEREVERQLPEIATQEVDPVPARVAIPRECAGIRPDVQIHDVNDNFNPPGNPVTLSPALASYLAGKPVKGYDDKRNNMVFADSFRLKNCRVCFATLEVRARHDAGPFNVGYANYSNDTIILGAAPFPTALRFMGSANLWSADLPNPKTMTLATTPAGLAALNQYLMTGHMPAYADFVQQDDSTIDSVKLSVYYY